MASVATNRCRLTHQQKKNICQYSADNLALAQAQLVSHFNSVWGTLISKSAMSNILKSSSKWLATDDTNASKLSEKGCVNKQLEEVLYLWFITNGPSGKGGDISGEVIREMAYDLAKDPRFEFSNG